MKTMLGISLLFVGFTLAHNGICVLRKSDPRAMAVMNFITGGLLLAINLLGLSGAAASQVPEDFRNAAGGLLFSFTYIIIGFYLVFKKDFFNVGLYGAFAAAVAVFFAVFAFKDGDYFMGALWVMWFLLWLEMPVENVFYAPLGKFPAIFLIIEGLAATGGPGLYLLFFK